MTMNESRDATAAESRCVYGCCCGWGCGDALGLCVQADPASATTRYASRHLITPVRQRESQFGWANGDAWKRHHDEMMKAERDS
jgi:hypothetical protein